MCVSTLKSIRREGENTRYQEFTDLDVTGVAMVSHFPLTWRVEWSWLAVGELVKAID